MKRATFKSQKDAPRQLRFISLPEKAKNDLDANKDYIYDENAGEGARVFVVDSGLNTKSTVSSFSCCNITTYLMELGMDE